MSAIPAGSRPLPGSSRITRSGSRRSALRRRRGAGSSRARRSRRAGRRARTVRRVRAPRASEPVGRRRAGRAGRGSLRAVMSGENFGPSTSAPTRCITRPRSAGSAPNSRTVPAVGATRPSRQRMVVGLSGPVGSEKSVDPGHVDVEADVVDRDDPLPAGRTGTPCGVPTPR